MLLCSSALRTTGWIGVAAIVVFSLLPGWARPHNALGLPGQYEHLLAYMLTAGTLSLAYRKATIRALLLTLLVICAALLEIAQIWVPGRTSQLIDFGASSIGAGCGLLAAAVIDQLVLSILNGEPMDRERERKPWG
jgi:VanZ family protein